MFLGHLGNWDHAGAWSTPAPGAGHDRRRAAASRRSCSSEFVAFRESPRHDDPAADRRRRRVPRADRRRCGGGGFVPLLADRDLTARRRRGRPASAQPARMAAGPAALALHDRRARCSPVSIRYERLRRRAGWRRDRHHWHDEVRCRSRRPAAATRASGAGDDPGAAPTRCRGDREHPQDWHMLQRVFVADLDPPTAAPRRCRA